MLANVLGMSLVNPVCAWLGVDSRPKATEKDVKLDGLAVIAEENEEGYEEAEKEAEKEESPATASSCEAVLSLLPGWAAAHRRTIAVCVAIDSVRLVPTWLMLREALFGGWLVWGVGCGCGCGCVAACRACCNRCPALAAVGLHWRAASTCYLCVHHPASDVVCCTPHPHRLPCRCRPHSSSSACCGAAAVRSSSSTRAAPSGSHSSASWPPQSASRSSSGLACASLPGASFRTCHAVEPAACVALQCRFRSPI